MSFDVIPTNGQTWVVFGGRDFADQQMFDDAMGDLIRIRGIPVKIVQGGARGADAMAKQWAVRHGIEHHEEKADWAKHGRAAGPIRNKAMLEKHHPDMAVSFPGGRGTADMVRRVKTAEIDLAEIRMKVAQ